MLVPFLLVVLVLAVPGDAAQPPAAKAGAPSTAETSWLLAVATWDAELRRAASRLRAVQSDPIAVRRLAAGIDAHLEGEYVLGLAPFGRCGQSLRRVGQPPTRRLAAVRAGLSAACKHYEILAGRGLEALSARDAELLSDPGVASQRANELVRSALDLVPWPRQRLLPVIGGRARQSRIEPALSRAARTLARKRVEVRCWSRDDWRLLLLREASLRNASVGDVLGLAATRGRQVDLAPSVCARLASLRYGHRQPNEPTEMFEAAIALVTLAHESLHASGIGEEATAECFALQRARRAAEALQIGSGYADRLVGLYWNHYGYLPRDYRSTECRDGGRLDLRPKTSTFP